MVMVDVDDEIYKNVKEFVEKNSVDFPNIKNFIDRASREKLKKEINKEVKK